VKSFPAFLPVQSLKMIHFRYVQIWKNGAQCLKMHLQNKKPLEDDQTRYKAVNQTLKAYKRFINDIVVSKYLGLVDSFLEAAPQVTFQLYLYFTKREDDSWWSKISKSQHIEQIEEILKTTVITADEILRLFFLSFQVFSNALSQYAYYGTRHKSYLVVWDSVHGLGPDKILSIVVCVLTTELICRFIGIPLHLYTAAI
jgi:hypothetical protein